LTQEQRHFLPAFPELAIVPASAELASDPPIAVPGTLQIEILEGTGIPVLIPIPSPDDALVFDNSSGGQMVIDGYLPSGSVRILVPVGGTAGIIRPAIGVIPKTRISVEKKWLVTFPSPFGHGTISFWAHKRVVVADADDSGVDGSGGDASRRFPASGRYSIDVNGAIS
jgi:hypothetical protein